MFLKDLFFSIILHILFHKDTTHSLPPIREALFSRLPSRYRRCVTFWVNLLFFHLQVFLPRSHLSRKLSKNSSAAATITPPPPLHCRTIYCFTKLLIYISNQCRFVILYLKRQYKFWEERIYIRSSEEVNFACIALLLLQILRI